MKVLNFVKEWAGVAAVIILIWQMLPAATMFGGLNVENYIPVIRQQNGYNSTLPITLSGASGDITTGDDLTVTDDATISGGTFTLTTSNSATSTATIGCVQTYATSTATPVRLLIGSIATTSPSHTGNNSVGHVLWGYGSCPI